MSKPQLIPHHTMVKGDIKTENEIIDETWANSKVVLVKKTDRFREYLLPFGWRKQVRKRLNGSRGLNGSRERWDVFIIG